MIVQRYALIVLLGVLVGVLITLGACNSMIPVPKESDLNTRISRDSGLTLHDLQEGRSIYIERCSGCHLLKSPENRSSRQWSETIKAMKSRAHLTDIDEKKILGFLQTYLKSTVDSIHTL